MLRKTTLTLEEILKEMPGATGCCCEGFDTRKGYPTGLLVNEIGQIFWAGDGDAAKAETELARLLGDASEDVRYIAWCYLSNGDHVRLGPTRTAMDEFQKREENGHVLALSA